MAAAFRVVAEGLDKVGKYEQAAEARKWAVEIEGDTGGGGSKSGRTGTQDALHQARRCGGLEEG
jgi:hypothetical protein